MPRPHLATIPLFLSLVLATSVGCTHRRVLEDGDLARTSEPHLREQFRVYPSDRVVSVYQASEEVEGIEREQILQVDLDRKTSGMLVGEEESEGHRRLWVSFSKSCRAQECAYGFEQADDGSYILTSAPTRNGYGSPIAYRGSISERNRLFNTDPVRLEVITPRPEH